MTMNILLTGAQGQLGRSLSERVQSVAPGWRWHALSRKALDITDADAVNAMFTRLQPSVVINAAAWTKVDAAEHVGEQAIAVNALGAANIAAAAAHAGARLLHISTDYVFKGDGTQLLSEAVPPAPVNMYGASKLAGEQAVQAEAPDAVIVRTSGLYSRYGSNFVRTVLQRGLEMGVLDVVDDQVVSPTWAVDLADALLYMAGRPTVAPGVYHYSGRQAVSWYDFACHILAYAARIDARWKPVVVRPVSSMDYAAPAVRPAYSALDCVKVSALGVTLSEPDQRLPALVEALVSADALDV